MLVCAGVLVLQNKPEIPRGKFKTPYVNSKYILPVLMIAGLYYAFAFNNKATKAFINNEPQIYDATSIVTSLDKSESEQVFKYLESIEVNNKTAETSDLEHLLGQYQDDEAKYAEVVKAYHFLILQNTNQVSVYSNTKFQCGYSYSFWLDWQFGRLEEIYL